MPRERVEHHGNNHTTIHREDGGRTEIRTDGHGSMVRHVDADGRVLDTRTEGSGVPHAEVVRDERR